MMMKKLLGLSLVMVSTLSLTACGGLPTCNDELDECTYGGAYTEERTIEAGKRKPAPEPVYDPAPAPAPAPVATPPAPEPVQDVEIMRSAEPEFKHISK